MSAMLLRMYTITMATVPIAPVNPYAPVAPGPSQIPTPIPTTMVKRVCTAMARCGEYQRSCTLPKDSGSTRSRPMENITRAVVLWMARKQPEDACHSRDLARLQEPRSHMLSEGDEWIRVLEERGHLVGVVETV